MIKKIILLSCMFCISLVFAAQTTPISLTPTEKDTLFKGEIIIKEVQNEGPKGKTFDAFGILKGNLDQALAILADYEKYPEFMPNVTSVKIVEVTSEGTSVNYILGLPLGKIKKYRLKLWSEKEQTSLKIFWVKVPWPEIDESETITDTKGYWLIEPSEREGFLIAKYHVYTDPGHIPFGFGWIVNMLTRDSLPDIIRSLKNRITTIYPK